MTATRLWGHVLLEVRVRVMDYHRNDMLTSYLTQLEVLTWTGSLNAQRHIPATVTDFSPYNFIMVVAFENTILSRFAALNGTVHFRMHLSSQSTGRTWLSFEPRLLR